MARILVVEPNHDTQAMLREQLISAGHEPAVVTSGAAAIQELGRHAAQMVITGWVLPDMNGSELLAKLRNGSGVAQLRVLVLARTGDGGAAAQALDQGADDVVAASAPAKELVARVGAALRRSPAVGKRGVYQVGPLHLHEATHLFTVHGEPVELAPAEYRLMAYFMANPDRVHDRQHLLENVWGRGQGIGQRTVDVHVRRLRALLEPRGCADLLATVRGFGYRFGQ